jgi:solute carrier family 39 (zinc transporter), member 1/2/3
MVIRAAIHRACIGRGACRAAAAAVDAIDRLFRRRRPPDDALRRRERTMVFSCAHDGARRHRVTTTTPLVRRDVDDGADDASLGRRSGARHDRRRSGALTTMFGTFSLGKVAMCAMCAVAVSSTTAPRATLGGGVVLGAYASETTPAEFASTNSTTFVSTFDTDNNGLLSVDEMDAIFETLHERTEYGASDAHAHGHDDAVTLTPTQVFASADANNDGELSAAEFANGCAGILRCAADEECEFDTSTSSASTSESTGASKYVGFKCAMGGAILAEAFVGGMAPTVLAKVLTSAVDEALGLMNAFSGGIFLSAGLTHILPHVIEAGASVTWSPKSYPLPYALVCLGYMLIFFVERVLFHTHGHTLEEHDNDEEHDAEEGGNANAAKHSHSHAPVTAQKEKSAKPRRRRMNDAEIAPYILLVAVSLHAVLAGVSLGVQSTRTQITAVAIAIISHKAPAAFSIGFAFLKSGVTTYTRMCAIMFAFACVTPIGIAIGIGIGSSSPMAALIIEGLAAGSFIYVGATEIATDEFETSAKACGDKHGLQAEHIAHSHRVHQAPDRKTRLKKFFAYAAGVGTILLAGLATHEDHD